MALTPFLVGWAPTVEDATSTAQLQLRTPGQHLLVTAGEVATTAATSGHLVLCGAVRLDDRAPLLAALSCAGEGLSDGQLVLEGWSRWGVDVVKHLVGAFAFAVWDGRTSLLHAVRDHVGLQPLYWTRTQQGVLLLAADVDELLAHPEVEADFDERAVLAACLGDALSLREQSVYRGIAKVLPGTVLEFRASGTTRSTAWWTPDLSPLRLAPQEWAATLSDLLERVHTDVTPSGVGVGVHASGGLDSSCVAALSQAALGRTGRHLVGGWSWSPPYDEQLPLPGDERERLGLLFDRLGVPVHFTRLTAEGLGQAMRDRLTVAGLAGLDHEPVVLRSAAEHGVSVLLSGWGGDECVSFNGRGAVAGLLRERRLATAVRGAARRSTATGPRLVRAAGSVLRREAATLGRRSSAGTSARLVEELRRRGFDPADVHEDGRAVLASSRTRGVVPGGAATSLALLRKGHVTQRIEAWAQLGRRQGVEYRYPLLDRRLVELALRVPDEVHLQGRSRWLFREAVAPFVGNGIAWGEAKSESAKWFTQQAMLADLDPVRPVGPEAAADIVLWWHRARRELHDVLGA